MNQILYMTATGDVTGTSIGGSLKSATVTAAAATATLVLRSGGSGGTIILALSAVANTSFQWCGDAAFSGVLHATIAGAGALVSVEW